MIRTFGAIESLLQGDDVVDYGDRSGAATIKPEGSRAVCGFMAHMSVAAARLYVQDDTR
jgi:hypothetical protein